MDLDARILEIFGRIEAPIRIPTARWLVCDLCDGVLDSSVNFALARLIDKGALRQTVGGWLELP